MRSSEKQRTGNLVRRECLRLLAERYDDPKMIWRETEEGRIGEENVAGLMLIEAGFLAGNDLHRITLAGMDYYRKETANPVVVWLKANWFAVFVAVMTASATIVGAVLAV